MTVNAVPHPEGHSLNHAQADTVALLRNPREGRPSFDPDLRRDLTELLEEELGPVTEGCPAPLVITKRKLSSVHGCEVRHLDEAARPFEPSAATVRGTVAHKALELSVQISGHPPARLVDGALARLAQEDGWAAPWLRSCDAVERAEVRAAAIDRVSKFLECFPPLPSSWRPVTESAWRAELCGGKVVLSGKVDLTIGGPDGPRAGKVVIDHKTGGPAPSHAEDLRFYALVETLRLGVPPWKLVSYYLDAGRSSVEVVTEATLEAAAHRVVAGARRLVELGSGRRAPLTRPSVACSWCPLREDCADGRRALAQWEEWRG